METQIKCALHFGTHLVLLFVKSVMRQLATAYVSTCTSCFANVQLAYTYCDIHARNQAVHTCTWSSKMWPQQVKKSKVYARRQELDSC